VKGSHPRRLRHCPGQARHSMRQSGGSGRDTKNSTISNAMLKVDPERYIECFIMEQNLVGVSMGVACCNRAVVFCSTFAAFFTGVLTSFVWAPSPKPASRVLDPMLASVLAKTVPLKRLYRTWLCYVEVYTHGHGFLS